MYKERVTDFDGQTDQQTYPVIEMRGRKLNVSNEFRHVFCAVNISFLQFSRKHYGPTDKPSYRDARTHLKMNAAGNVLCAQRRHCDGLKRENRQKGIRSFNSERLQFSVCCEVQSPKFQNPGWHLYKHQARECLRHMTHCDGNGRWQGGRRERRRVVCHIYNDGRCISL